MTGRGGEAAVLGLLALGALALGWLAVLDRRAAPTRRLRGLRVARPAVATREQAARLPRYGVGCGVALAVWALLGGALGGMCGLGAAVVATRWLARATPSAERERQRRLAADLPMAVDLLAACLAAGSTPPSAVAEVARAVGGPVGGALTAVLTDLRMGGDPTACWQRLTSEPVLAPLGRALARCADSGAPIAAGVARFADDCRVRRQWAARDAARRVGVRAAAPLGLCFLPAFVLVGVVPVVVGLAGQVMRG
jgi:Flp pilus assembly protein TadB